MKYLLPPLAIAACVGLGWLVYTQAQKHVDTPADKPKKQPLAVEVARLATQDLEQRIELVGSLEPRAQVTVRSRTRGYITRLPFDVGDELTEKDGLPVIPTSLASKTML